MESFLQIAPHSLAIVLSRVGAGEAVGAAGVSESDELPRHHTGYEIFADFKAENAQHHVWNQRITEAVSDTFFLGWIDEHVLLIQGKEDHLEVLREGWMRRSLNPPRGFTIKYLGDVSPISMSPISQSQFIPLGEVLVLAISAMNSAHKPVTQEALTEHLQTCFPGVPTPTEEVLHHTLNMLVRERKIFPTPDGYFIVTPQTYFITPSLIRTGSKWYHLDERSAERHQHQNQQQNQQTQCTSPLSGTITPSTSGGVRDRSHPKSNQNHSGGGGGVESFFNNTYRGDDPPSHHTTLQLRSPKDHREAYSSPHSPQSPPQPAGGNTEKSRSTLGFPFKTDTLTKHRGGGGGTGELEKQPGSGTASRKFGLKLFRLSFKKDKTKQLATFSAQFPPEEWPLRDEEAPSQLPRHIEMEIIRRINPDLTVENLARHTAVMKRLEEERAQRSKASSANHSSRSRRSGGRHRKPSQTKLSRSHSKTRASRGEQSESSHLELTDRDYRAYSSSLARSPREHALAMERQRTRLHLAHSNPNILDSSHLPVTPEWDVSGELAKRRTEMPFPEPCHGPSAHHSKVHRSHSHTQERKSRNERSDKAKERSRSMENSKGPLGAGLIGPPSYYDDRSRYYTDDGTLRANQGSCHYTHATPPLAKMPGESLGLDSGRSLEKCKSRDSLPAYSPKPQHNSVPPDGYFQCSGSSEAILTAPSPLGTLGKSSQDGLKLGCTERQTERQTPHPQELKEDFSKAGPKGGSLPPIPLSMPDPPVSNARPLHSASCGQEKRKEIFSKDTLFKPPPSLPLPGYSSLRKTPVLASSTLSSSCDALDSQEAFDAPKPLVATPSAPIQGIEPTTSAAEASFDYYNVSDDDELEEGGTKSTGEDGKSGGGVVGMGGGGAGTMQWLLEREKERDLQRRFERTLTFPGSKENLPEPSQNQQSAHSARLDSMDSSSVTVDSGFNSPRTRESLASNTSSIVESNRRQNLALSPGHLGITNSNGPPFSFRTIPEPAGSQPEKLQKPNACLASITSV
ncbi:storkhead-box protein 2-like isoform X1 [Corythoichthys intestinalis]|uniref:storkhead-box protein 2-like isoform X1 n=2 Tax=Corythoichthys intestinalis TaxID=161448 RepID=UPI0025A55828|nr:storkhead-box protein 2-like isoform X1 [Corythoichthys intestinalis]XP_061793461.1 storkhead-box protein 2-like [Nerophis lumbriciformis]